MRLSELKRLAPQLHEVLARYGASNPAVFGSVARDQARSGSDVDLVVDLPPGASLFDRAELKSALEDLLLNRVDLIRRRNLKPEIKPIVEAEAIPCDECARSPGPSKKGLPAGCCDPLSGNPG